MIIDMPRNEDIPALRSLWREAFGDDDAFLDCFFTTAYSQKRARVARCDGAILGALYWFDCECEAEKCAYIYAVATAKMHRGKGICTALMQDTHTHLKTLGYASAVLVPSSESLVEFYEKIGYAVCSFVNEISVIRGALPCPISRVEKEEYGLLRRKYLPAGGVLQEDAGLDFLSTMAELYKGRDFLLAADIKGDTLWGIELLGNITTENAAAITTSLGAVNGRFRTPGNTKPFAMHLPLLSHNTPTYFGIAFD